MGIVGQRPALVVAARDLRRVQAAPCRRARRDRRPRWRDSGRGARARGPPKDACRQLLQLVAWSLAVFAEQLLGVSVEARHRFGTLFRGDQRAQQRAQHVFVDRIDFAIATREFRHPHRTQRRGGAQQRLAPELQQVLPLGACPLAEHRKRAEAQAVEEAAARNGGRRRPVAGGVRGAHRGHIARQGDAQAALLRHERVVDAPLAEQRAQPIEIDPEIVLRRLLAGVGPHQRGDLLAPHPVRARGEVGEEVARRAVRDVEVRVADLDARRGEQPEHRLVCTHRARCPRTRRASAIDGLPDRSEPCVRAARMHSRRRRADFAARVACPAAS